MTRRDHCLVGSDLPGQVVQASEKIGPPYGPMQILQGLAVSSGVAFGEALIVDNEGVRIPNRFVSREVVEDEIEQLEKAIAAVSREIEVNRKTVSAQLGEQCGAIFSAHLQMLHDQQLQDQLHTL